MPRYVGLLKYTPEALAAAREQGFQARLAAMEQAAASVGGSVESVDVLTGGHWDLLVRMENPTGQASLSMVTQTKASGNFVDMLLIESFTPDQADAAIAATAIDWTPPTEA